MTNPADHLATAIAAGFELVLRAALSANQAAVDAVCELVAADEPELDFAMFDLPCRVLPRVAVASSRSRDGWRYAVVRGAA